MIEIGQYRQNLSNALIRNMVVKKLYLFGSALTPRFNEQSSDIDVLIETDDLQPEQKGELLLTLWEDLERIFGRKVDLLTENSLTNPYLLKEIERTKKLIYDGQSKQILI
ncbi:MAG: nucleotidyltransferase domain-containing protein [Bacteroidales bacterium]|jgi:predicted nucleotidyltransferase|nr:nucleotidyltransferase domain-containing protein [Bacteroidales bacterium]